jgi:hypothetical protein
MMIRTRMCLAEPLGIPASEFGYVVDEIRQINFERTSIEYNSLNVLAFN